MGIIVWVKIAWFLKDTGSRPYFGGRVEGGGAGGRETTNTSQQLRDPAKSIIIWIKGHSPNWHTFVFVDWSLRSAEYLQE